MNQQQQMAATRKKRKTDKSIHNMQYDLEICICNLITTKAKKMKTIKKK